MWRSRSEGDRSTYHEEEAIKIGELNVEEDVTLCYAWMNAHLEATVGSDQTKETFWKRIDEYYASHVKVPSNRTQDSLAHCWSVIQDCCN